MRIRAYIQDLYGLDVDIISENRLETSLRRFQSGLNQPLTLDLLPVFDGSVHSM